MCNNQYDYYVCIMTITYVVYDGQGRLKTYKVNKKYIFKHFLEKLP